MPWLSSVGEMAIQRGPLTRYPGINTNTGETGLLWKIRGGQLGEANKKSFLRSDKTGGVSAARTGLCSRK